ncbi:Hypothetical protein FKW44_018859, partial [Caligus rogercresseyi]
SLNNCNFGRHFYRVSTPFRRIPNPALASRVRLENKAAFIFLGLPTTSVNLFQMLEGSGLVVVDGCYQDILLLNPGFDTDVLLANDEALHCHP